MIATLTVGDVGAVDAGRLLLWRPAAGSVRGLRWASAAIAAPLASRRPPSLRRVALFAFWDDEAAAEDFLATHPAARRFDGQLRAILRPLRASGSWPGLPADLPTARAVHHEGPVVVFTLGRLHLTQTVRFLRTSRPAEQEAVASAGMVWGTAAARPPFVATISIWRDSDSVTTYAYDRTNPPHPDAIAEQRRKDFHRRSAFIRFAAVALEGSLGRSNPLSATTVAELSRGL